jgi:hypothetical protein
MENNTFAETSARWYRIVDAEERLTLNSFNIISSFYGLKSMHITKANKPKNIRHNIKFTFPHQKKSFQKENMFEPFDVICHVTVPFYISSVVDALTLYVCYINQCALLSATIITHSTIHKKYRKRWKHLKIA